MAEAGFGLRRRRAGLIRVLLTTAMGSLGWEQGVAAGQTDTQAIADLRAEISALRHEYDARLAELEDRLARLEKGSEPGETPPAAEAAPAGSELDRIRAAALEAAGPPAGGVEPAAASPPGGGGVARERNLNRLNPEISFTGIVVGNAASPGRQEFRLQEFELDLQASLDPFSRTRWTLAVGDEGVEIEEGYVRYNALTRGLELLGGKFRQRFGNLNRQHLHALPQSDYPLALRTYFGDEGLSQTGLSLTWLLPRPWASANELTFEITDGENEEAFAGESFEDFAYLGHLKNFWELSPATYFEWGLSGIIGRTGGGGDSRVWGTDLTLRWSPPRRAKYREITWRSEIFLSQRDDDLGSRRDAWGGYTYLEGLLARNLYGGVRLDRAEDPLEPERLRWGFVPYLSWWQSEYVRLRAEYGFQKDDHTDEEAKRFTLQLTWAAGPHKHETY